jgi:hypothetical protein
VINTRVFNDAPTGTSGFTEPLLVPDAFVANETVSIPIPADLANFRVNVGIRTLDDADRFPRAARFACASPAAPASTHRRPTIARTTAASTSRPASGTDEAGLLIRPSGTFSPRDREKADSAEGRVRGAIPR